jgi:hypothetical protein
VHYLAGEPLDQAAPQAGGVGPDAVSGSIRFGPAGYPDPAPVFYLTSHRHLEVKNNHSPMALDSE